jgi:hypothetical protein
MPTPPDPGGHDLLADSRKVIDAAAASLSSIGGHIEAPTVLLDTMRRQAELLQDLIERERRFQKQAASQLLAPIDAVFDLLEASGATLRQQAEALEAAGQALEESARLVKAQASLFEQAIGTLREPSERARAIVGLEPRAGRGARRRPRRGS